MINNRLIIFARPLKVGAVKRRLAKVIGDERALVLYTKMFNITLEAAQSCFGEPILYYSEQPDFNEGIFRIQSGNDIGERMHKAITQELHDPSYEQVCLIGSDCPDINAALLDQAFESLKAADVVIGPANDGGYYLIGMNKPHPELFSKINWSTSSVLSATIKKCTRLGLSYQLLEEQSDLDVVDDIPKGW
jgi:rSAM/selenodomain-associated transferase 1